MADAFSLSNAFSEVTVRVVGDDENLKKVLADDRLALTALTKKAWQIPIKADDKVLQKQLTDIALRMDSLSRKQLKIGDESDVRTLLREHSALLGIETSFDRLAKKAGVATSDSGVFGRFVAGFGGSFAGFGKGAQGKTGLGAVLGSLGPGLGGLFGGAGAAGLGTAGGVGSALAGTLGVTGGLAALAAALVAIPALATAAAGAITTNLGGGILGLGVLTASTFNGVQKHFSDLTAEAGKSLKEISEPFGKALDAILKLADKDLPKIMKPLGQAMATLAPPFEQLGKTLVTAFAQPAVGKSIVDLGTSFAMLIKAFTPQLPAIVKTFADGISTMAQAISKNPKLITGMADVLAFLLKIPGYILSAIGYLTDFAGWLTIHLPRAYDTLLGDSKKFWDSLTGGFDTLRGNIVHTWDLAWTTITGATRTGITDAVALFRSLPGKAIAALTGFGHDLGSFAHAAMEEFFSGLTSVATSIRNWLSGFWHGLIGLGKAILGIGSPSKVFFAMGRDMMLGAKAGIEAHQHHVAAAARNAMRMSGSGALGGDQAANEALARRMFPFPASMWPAFVNLVMAESGFNRFADNPSSGAYGIAQALPATKYPFAGQAAGGSHAGAQLAWMFDYIRSVYGNPVNAWGHEMAFHWYDKGGYLPTGLSLALNRTGVPERVIAPGQEKQHVVVEWRGGPSGKLEAALWNWLQRNVRLKGGGSAQLALGTSG